MEYENGASAPVAVFESLVDICLGEYPAVITVLSRTVGMLQSREREIIQQLDAQHTFAASLNRELSDVRHNITKALEAFGTDLPLVDRVKYVVAELKKRPREMFTREETMKATLQLAHEAAQRIGCHHTHAPILDITPKDVQDRALQLAAERKATENAAPKTEPAP